jgi:acyl-homoserine lactone acylase PvdQ
LDPLEKQAISYLKAWDTRFTDWNVAFTLYSAWVEELEEILFPPSTDDVDEQRLWKRVVTPSTLLHALEGRQSSVPLSHEYLAGRSASEVCLQALAEAIQKVRTARLQTGQETSTFQGPGRENWQGSRGFKIDQMNFWFTRQRRLKIDPLPPIPYQRRGTYLFGVEMTPEVLTYSVVLPGESGNPESPHFADQRDLAGWNLFKMVASSREQLLGVSLD